MCRVTEKSLNSQLYRRSAPAFNSDHCRKPLPYSHLEKFETGAGAFPNPASRHNPRGKTGFSNPAVLSNCQPAATSTDSLAAIKRCDDSTRIDVLKPTHLQTIDVKPYRLSVLCHRLRGVNPSGAWTTQQARNFEMFLQDESQPCTILQRDQDTKYVLALDDVFTAPSRRRRSNHRTCRRSSNASSRRSSTRCSMAFASSTSNIFGAPGSFAGMIH